MTGALEGRRLPARRHGYHGKARNGAQRGGMRRPCISEPRCGESSLRGQLKIIDFGCPVYTPIQTKNHGVARLHGYFEGDRTPQSA